jgi:ferritin-like metal-binding protein YciE
LPNAVKKSYAQGQQRFDFYSHSERAAEREQYTVGPSIKKYIGRQTQLNKQSKYSTLMTDLRNLEDLFHYTLKDIYSAETQIIDALPKMKESARSKDLKNAFDEHLEQTRNQQKRLQEIADNLGIDITGEKCEAMEGLIREAQELISENAEDEVRDAGLIADAQKIEHYEISAYGTAREYAKALDKQDVAEKLNQTLQEEANTDQRLNKLAIENINKKAKANA